MRYSLSLLVALLGELAGRDLGRVSGGSRPPGKQAGLCCWKCGRGNGDSVYCHWVCFQDSKRKAALSGNVEG